MCVGSSFFGAVADVRENSKIVRLPRELMGGQTDEFKEKAVAIAKAILGVGAQLAVASRR